MSLISRGVSALNPYQAPFPLQTVEVGGAYFTFQGNVKMTDKKPEGERPLDPSETMKRKGAEWPRACLLPQPASQKGLKESRISLNGEWELAEDRENGPWNPVPVPGELFALGYRVVRDKNFFYRKEIRIPEEWSGQKIILEFEMIYEYAEIYVNGRFIRDHKGAFTTFDCDITEASGAGKTALLEVLCRHSHDGTMDWMTEPGQPIPGFAGIIGNVTLFCLPKNHLTHISYVTEFDDAYVNALLSLDITFPECWEGTKSVRLTLIDPEGAKVDPVDGLEVYAGENGAFTGSIGVAMPLKWDAEHPNLYTLYADTGEVVYEVKVGFRVIEKRGEKVYINGVPVKLRGAGLYGHDPLLGRVYSRDQIETIIKAAKWANINFLRTAAYPERRDVYDLCDQYGIYVEECMPINFQRGSWDSRLDLKIRPSSNIPRFEEAYLQQTAEVIERDRNHPSVIIWEYGNESDWGMNFDSMLQFIGREDPTRLTAGTWDNTHTSIPSYHYPQYDELLPGAALYDECLHVTAYAQGTLRRDPGIRNAWGESVRRAWEAIYDSPGTLGNAIFAMNSFVIQRPDMVFGGGYEWGLVDPWLREKPELWLTKKAYSPVKLPDREVKLPMVGDRLVLPVYNRYNHTDLSEVTFEWEVFKAGYTGEKGVKALASGSLKGQPLAPGFHGAMILPARSWTAGEVLKVRVIDRFGMEADGYLLTLRNENGTDPAAEKPRISAPGILSVTEQEEAFYLSSEDFSIVFRKSDCLLHDGKIAGERILLSGPYLDLQGDYHKSGIFQNGPRGVVSARPSEWRPTGYEFRKEDGKAVFIIEGELSRRTERGSGRLYLRLRGPEGALYGEGFRKRSDRHGSRASEPAEALAP